MNDMSRPSGGVPVPRQSGGRREKVASALERAQSWADTTKAFGRLIADHPWLVRNVSQARDWLHWDAGAPLTPEAGRRVGQLLADLPAMAALEQTETILAGLSQAPVDRSRLSLVIALMIDGYPNARPHDGETYLETLVHFSAQKGVTPQIAARAWEQVALTCAFPPAPAEFLEICEKFNTVERDLDRVRQALDVRRRLESRLGELAALPPSAEEPMEFVGLGATEVLVRETLRATPAPHPPTHTDPQSMARAMRDLAAKIGSDRKSPRGEP